MFLTCARTPAAGKEKCEEHLREDATAPIQDQSNNRKDLEPEFVEMILCVGNMETAGGQPRFQPIKPKQPRQQPVGLNMMGIIKYKSNKGPCLYKCGNKIGIRSTICGRCKRHPHLGILAKPTLRKIK